MNLITDPRQPCSDVFLIDGGMTVKLSAQTAVCLLLAYSPARESRLPGRSRVRQNSPSILTC